MSPDSVTVTLSCIASTGMNQMMLGVGFITSFVIALTGLVSIFVLIASGLDG